MNDRVEEEYDITEEVVLTRWDKLKQWIEIVVATKKVAVLIWSLVFATGGAVIVGEATDTKPIREAAVSIGLLGEEVPLNPTANPYIDELLNLQEDVFRLQDEVKAHTHKITYEAHSHDPAELIEHDHEQPDVVPVLIEHNHDKPEPMFVEHTHPQEDIATKSAATSQTAIDSALADHIKFDH